MDRDQLVEALALAEQERTLALELRDRAERIAAIQKEESSKLLYAYRQLKDQNCDLSREVESQKKRIRQLESRSFEAVLESRVNLREKQIESIAKSFGIYNCDTDVLVKGILATRSRAGSSRWRGGLDR